jgi:hypothetical protein
MVTSEVLNCKVSVNRLLNIRIKVISPIYSYLKKVGSIILGSRHALQIVEILERDIKIVTSNINLSKNVSSCHCNSEKVWLHCFYSR